MTDFVPPPPLRALIDSLVRIAADAGVNAYVVGGTVRDAVLGRGIHDLDLAADADAVAWARSIADKLGGHFVLLDDVHAIARVVLERGPVRSIDVAQLQGTVEHDMRRRDFTVDALAVPLGGTQIVDVTGGLRDLQDRVVRMNDPAVFDEDPLRLLRGVRLAAELGFRLDAATETEIRRRATRVNETAAERRRDELARIFALEDAYPGLVLLDRAGLIEALLPEVAGGRSIPQPAEYHAYDVFEHNMRAVEALDLLLAPKPASDDWMWQEFWSAFAWCQDSLRTSLAEEMSQGRTRGGLLKVAALLHDVAKPQTRTEQPDGRVRFFGHADLGADMARLIMRRLRFSERESAFVSLLVAEHLRPVQLSQIGEAPTRRALYRFYRDLGDAAVFVLLLALADAASARGKQMTREEWSLQVAYMNSLLVRSREDEGIVSAPKILTGHDIMSELGIPAGPQIGKMLEALREAQATGEVRSKLEGLAFVRKLLREEGSGR